MEKLIKYIPNLLSASRIIAAAFLFTFNSFYEPTFLIIYIYCAATDFFDGRIARKYHCESMLGAALDTIGDLMTYLPLIKILLVQRLIPGWIFVWLFVDIVICFIGALIPLIRFKTFFSPHTILSKFLGAALFFMPLAVQMVKPLTYLILLASYATLCLVEVFSIQVINKEPYDALSIIHAIKNARKISD
ncbi:MAG: CDP-alcohol phosphatidyltransferase family protein [Clostridia bacterium]|nr:CDP-alcohol phosphatidyltransferase family protein [Clostridia bacterium]